MRAEKEAHAQRQAEIQRHSEEVVAREKQKYQEDQRVATRATLCEQVAALQLDALPQGVEQARAAWAEVRRQGQAVKDARAAERRRPDS